MHTEDDRRREHIERVHLRSAEQEQGQSLLSPHAFSFLSGLNCGEKRKGLQS